MKGGDAVIAVDVGVEIRQRIFTGFSKDGVKTIQIVSVACANLILENGALIVIDGQMEVDDTVAAIHGRELLSVVT